MPKEGPLYALHSNGTVKSTVGGANGAGSSNAGNGNNAASDHVYRVFSVDDDPDEIEHDIKYLEGLHDGLKNALHASKSKAPLGGGISSSTPNLSGAGHNVGDSDTGAGAGAGAGADASAGDSKLKPEQSRSTSVFSGPSDKKKGQSEIEPYKFIIQDHEQGNEMQTDDCGNNGKGKDDDDHYHDQPTNDYIRHAHNVDEEDGQGFDRHSNASSIESFTLRERQDAINETHPFGIRIWKPALYKKQRSVQKVAAEDIHETKLKKITWPVKLTNIVWSVTLGLILFLCCICTGVVVCAAGFLTKSSREYGNFLFRLAKYLFWPFGKVVYLTQEKQYWEEDRDEGISAQQFYNWATSYSNRLFFHRSQAENNHSLISSNNNTRLQHPSYGSIREHLSATHQNTSLDGLSSSVPRGTDDGEEYADANDDNNAGGPHRRYFGRGKWSWGRAVFYICFHLVLQPIVLVLTLITWLFVFTIPMSNILWNLLYHIRRHPLALGFKSIKNRTNQESSLMKTQKIGQTNVLLCTFRCAGWHYYKFTVDGTNIIVVNLLFLVFFTIVDFYFLKHYLGLHSWLNHDTTVFALCLASIIPLAFYIGQAVASISAQTSMGVGAVINAFFSTVVEIFLYCVALKQGKGLLVEGSMIGSILGAVLLLPGLSMCGGALNRKTQRYNPASAGVSSAMLIFSMIVMFVPTILYQIYGGYEINCSDKKNQSLSFSNVVMAISKETCYFSRPPLTFTKMYTHVLEPISVSCAIVLFLAYIVGLWFTLRTHAVVIWQLPISEQAKDVSNSRVLEQSGDTPQEPTEDNGGHESPNWSRGKSTFVLLFATISYAIIAEILVSCVDTVLEDIPSLNPKFLGLTIFALVPNTTEFLNAISFAIHGNVALSMEIGSAYALQVCLLQIPALVLYSIFYTWNCDHSVISIRDSMFALVFPNWDLVACMASVFMFTYLYAEGKSNYFKGSMLILLYIITVLGFYFQGIIDDWNAARGID